MVVKSFLNPQKGKHDRKKHFHSLEAHDQSENSSPKHHFQISYTSIPCQLIKSPRMTLQPSQRWKWSQITVRNLSCVRLILALRETLSL